ncbi:MAG: DUF6384 family protein [Siculibacillus sp.]
MADVATQQPSTAGVSPAVASAPQKLDELMLAMDVVDTLRHQENLATKELDEDVRKAQLIKRLKEIYAAQGIEVSDRIVEEGVKALEESRFTYTPPPPSLARTLALMWVDRRRWGLAIGGVVLAAGLAIGSYSYFVVGGERRAAEAARIEITQTLPADLAKAARAARDEAKVPAATARIDEIVKRGEAAIARRDAPVAKVAVADLDKVTGTLREAWEARIVSRPGVRSGVWRVPKANPSARNHYLIVEAIGAGGTAQSRAITSEETQVTKSVTLWGQRVPKATFDRVAADKQNDGIIQNPVLGEKRRGEIDVRWNLPVEAGAITEW